MIRDTGAYCLRQTPILTLLAVLLLLVVLSLLRMNCSSFPLESVTKDIWLLSLKVDRGGLTIHAERAWNR